MDRTDQEAVSARAVASSIAEGRISAVDQMEITLDRIVAVEPVLKAFIHFDAAAARAAAAACDGSRGRLSGVPVAVKDIFDTHDMPTRLGSPIYVERRPARDAAAVAAIRAAGGIVIGKTVTTEFAYAHPGPTTHPQNPAHSPGGSSSGSAAAVAAGLVPLGIGTQTAGSVIRPAAFCGIVGFKPSFSLVNRAGVLSFAESFDTIGTFSLSVDDAALLVGVLTGRDDLALAAQVEAPPRIGFCRTPEWESAEPASRSAVEQTAAWFDDAGAKVLEVTLPPACTGLQQVHKDIMAHEASRAFAHEMRTAPDQLSPILSALLRDGRAVTAAAYAERLEEADLARAEMANLFDGVDVILTPSAIGEAPEGLGSTGDALFNRVWTLLGGPAIHLPTGRGPAGLPVGVQLVGPRFGDAATVGAALWAEQVIGDRGAFQRSSRGRQ